MSFEFTCPHCGKKLEAETEWIGSKGQCPSCNKEITITLPQDNIDDTNVDDKIHSSQKELRNNFGSNVDNNRSIGNTKYNNSLRTYKILIPICVFVIVMTCIIFFKFHFNPLSIIHFQANKDLLNETCTKEELDIVTDVQEVTGMIIGEKINMSDVIVDSKTKDLYVKKYKPGSFMKFNSCTVDVAPISGIISGFTFNDSHECDYSYQTKLDKRKDDVMDNVELKYNIDLDKKTEDKISSSGKEQREFAGYAGKKYTIYVSYSKSESNFPMIGGFVLEFLTFGISNRDLKAIKYNEDQLNEKQKRKEELKAKGY